MSSTVKESGHYALAGFLYQLLGSGVEAFEICSEPSRGDALDDLLILECFGEDAFVPPANGRRPKLVQYKYTSTNATLQPAQVRKILKAFLQSTQAHGLTPSTADYELVTNLAYSSRLEQWKESKNRKTELEALIQGNSVSRLTNVGELATIYQRLKHRPQTRTQLRDEIDKACKRFGVLEQETDTRIRELVGFLFEKASDPHDRVVRRADIHKALAGFDAPFDLLGPESIDVRRKDVMQYQRDETSGRTTISRSITEDIAIAVLEHPFIVVHGDGGCGKSIAVSDAILAGIQDSTGPPGFGVILRATVADLEHLIGRVAQWRHQIAPSDRELDTTLDRLRRSFAADPLIVICVDAIDEKAGNPRLPEAVQDCIRNLIDRAVTSFEKNGVPRISVILACRRVSELEKLSRGFGLRPRPHEIAVGEFSNSELEQLAQPLVAAVKERIISHLQIASQPASGASRRALRALPEEVTRALAHPVLWRFFSELTEQQQQLCLDGELGLLASAYLNWFREKADIRQPGLGDECNAALRAVARHFPKDSFQIGDKDEHWILPCKPVIGQDVRLPKQLMTEALSAGILTDEEDGGRRWRWKHPWLCEYLRKENHE